MTIKKAFTTLGTLLVAVAMIATTACTPTGPLPQPRRVVEPSSVAGGVQTPQWDIAAVAYEHQGQGLDYQDADLEPVYLVFKNKSNMNPRVLIDQTRGVARDGEYLAYDVNEATQLVFSSESFSNKAKGAGKTAAVSTLIGAGLGALLGTIGGGDNIWKGALIGGAGGALAGGTAGGVATSDAELKQTIRQELVRYGWSDEPVPSQYTKVGYLYFPARGISFVRVVVRVGGKIQNFNVPVTFQSRPAN